MSSITLRLVEETDLAIFFQQQLDEAALKIANFPRRDKDDFYNHWHKIMMEEQNILRAIQFEGEVAGNIVCWGEQPERLVGFWLGRDFWRQGIASTALKLFLIEVKERPLGAHVARSNHGSIRVLEKCGFIRQGESESEITYLLPGSN